MPTYKYKAHNPKTGKTVTSTVQADTESAASKLISAQGFTPIHVRAEGKTGIAFYDTFKNRVPAKDRVLFSRQLSTLINAGLPLLQALRSVEEQTANKPLKIIQSEIITAVQAGSTLADAMAKHPDVFNTIYVSMIAAGEASGTLDKSLERLAIQQEKEADLNSKIRGAMVYPAIVVFVMILVVGFMIVKVIPQVKQMYEGLPGAKLPLITRIMLAISDFVVHRWYIVVILLIVGAFFMTRWARTGPGKEAIDKFKMHAWPFGTLFMKVYMARFARTGTTLVAAGVPMLQMLNITSKAVNNVHVERSITKASEKVRAGKGLADSLEHDPNFLSLVPSMIKIGEQSGALEDMMAKVAEYYEKEVDQEVANISATIEPVMMILLGIVAFGIVAAVLLPIYGLAGQSGLGG